jgi:hypothetical protein
MQILVVPDRVPSRCLREQARSHRRTQFQGGSEPAREGGSTRRREIVREKSAHRYVDTLQPNVSARSRARPNRIGPRSISINKPGHASAGNPDHCFKRPSVTTNNRCCSAGKRLRRTASQCSACTSAASNGVPPPAPKASSQTYASRSTLSTLAPAISAPSHWRSTMRGARAGDRRHRTAARVNLWHRSRRDGVASRRTHRR